jgi:hypothetical protein
VNPNSLVAIADVQLDAAFDERTKPESKDGLLESARKSYQKALQVDPKHKDALLGMARFCARIGERENAVETYKKYLALYPDDVDARKSLDCCLAKHREIDKPAPANADETRLRDFYGARTGAIGVDPEPSNLSVCFEGQLLRIPTKQRDLLKLKLADGDILTAEQVKQLFYDAQTSPQSSIMSCPRLTVDSGQTGRLHICDERFFVTGVEAVKVKEQTVLVPKNKAVEIGHVFTFDGKISPDKKSVDFQASLTRTWVEGNVELVPLKTPAAGAKGTFTGAKVFMEQYLQAADVRTEKIEKKATVPVDRTIVLRSWTETEEKPLAGKKKSKPEMVEYTVIPLVTVRVRQDTDGKSVTMNEKQSPSFTHGGGVKNLDIAVRTQPAEGLKSIVYRLKPVDTVPSWHSSRGYFFMRK